MRGCRSGLVFTKIFILRISLFLQFFLDLLLRIFVNTGPDVILHLVQYVRCIISKTMVEIPHSQILTYSRKFISSMH